MKILGDYLHEQVRNPYLDFLGLGLGWDSRDIFLEKETFSTFANTEFMNNMRWKK